MQQRQGLGGRSHPTSSCPGPSKGCSQSYRWKDSFLRRPMKIQRLPKSESQCPWTRHSSSWCWWCSCLGPSRRRRSQALLSSRTQMPLRSRPRQLHLRSQHLLSELGWPLHQLFATRNYDTSTLAIEQNLLHNFHPVKKNVRNGTGPKSKRFYSFLSTCVPPRLSALLLPEHLTLSIHCSIILQALLSIQKISSIGILWKEPFLLTHLKLAKL